MAVVASPVAILAINPGVIRKRLAAL